MSSSNYRRPEYATLLARLTEAPQRLIIVVGPRQVGKTTLVRAVLADVGAGKPSRYIAVDNPGADHAQFAEADDMADIIDVNPVKDSAWLIRQWELARASARQSEPGFVLALDEIQHIARWSETVKGLWDADRAANLAMHVMLLGSAPLLVQRGLTEALTGRYELIRLNHWTYDEMHQAFGWSLDEYFYFGGYPGAAGYIRDQRRWRDYVRDALITPSIEKDVFEMNRVDKKSLLKRVFQLGCDYSGQILTLSKMAADLREDGDKDKAHTNTIADYLTLLTQAGLLAGLQIYSGMKIRVRASPPKLNVLNTALMSVEAGYSFEAAKADRTYWGRLVESAVGAHLYNTGIGDCEIYYWRQSPDEVDFVIARGRCVTAFEVKSGKKQRSAPGLHAFAAAFPGCKTYLVGEGGIALTEFLSVPAEHWLE